VSGNRFQALRCKQRIKLSLEHVEGLSFAKILSARDFNRIQRCRPQAKCGKTIA